jgi:hypothetical protein
MNYNFCRIHQTLRVTPAMESGIANHVWTLEEIAGLMPSACLNGNSSGQLTIGGG